MNQAQIPTVNHEWIDIRTDFRIRNKIFFSTSHSNFFLAIQIQLELTPYLQKPASEEAIEYNGIINDPNGAL